MNTSPIRETFEQWLITHKGEALPSEIWAAAWKEALRYAQDEFSKGYKTGVEVNRLIWKRNREDMA